MFEPHDWPAKCLASFVAPASRRQFLTSWRSVAKMQVPKLPAGRRRYKCYATQFLP